MRKLAILSVLVLGSAFAPFWAAPAAAILYPSCDVVCPSSASTARCSCPVGSPRVRAATTCGVWDTACYL